MRNKKSINPSFTFESNLMKKIRSVENVQTSSVKKSVNLYIFSIYKSSTKRKKEKKEKRRIFVILLSRWKFGEYQNIAI